MATPAVEGGPGGGGGGVAAAPRAGQQQQGGFAQSLTGVIRIAVFWYFASKFFAPKKPSDPAILMSNLFQKGEPLDMWVYLSEHERFTDFGNEGALVWHENGIPYAIWGPESVRSLSLKYYPSEDLKQNGSLYAHVFFARSGYTPDPNDPEFQPLAAFGRTHPIVIYLPKSKADKKKSLLGNSEGSDAGEILKEVVDDNQVDLKDDGPVEWVSYWKPNVTINLVDDFTGYPHNGVPPNIAPCILIYSSRVFLEGNPYLLAVTMVVSLLHSVFDMLAFKNDIQFWNKNKSMEGLSAKSVIVSFISQLIVFLYLLDNDTSWMILASSGIGCCIEFWKIGKAMHIEIDRSGRIPMLRFRDRESYAGNKTKEYDDLAMKYLSYVLFLLVGCSSVYSLMYEQHKSWYSWILSSLTSCVYMFGFIMMCPQLFINYKLKSVAHLPWRQMTYKFLNTIIDDLFAFVIKMPTLHRLSVFRDDLIFLIYLYQRWVYPVDKKRINEFGFGGEDDQAAETSNANAIEDDDKKTN
ncbi:Cleft lip and palate transmembrane protein 1 [Cucurbita argyrosperma subsp. argyrosperma]|nr:Cleft lip and palate transmembrane protein 1 [Cucurbita argyrosperma subsp. argyrosperma]